MTTVTAVVLAAGASQRMGEAKLLLPFRGSTVLNATIAAVEASRVNRVIVVTGARAEAVEASLAILITSSPFRGGDAEGGGGGRGSRQPPAASRQPESEDSSSPSGGGAAEGDAGGRESYQPPAASRQPEESSQQETTSFFRYVVRGWRGRKR